MPETITQDAAPTGEAPARALAALAGKYLTFRLADELHGLPIVAVRELVGLLPIAPLPRAPASVRGVVNLRGRVIPVVDLRLQLGLPRCEATDQTVIVVLQARVAGRSLTAGILVDRVLDVTRLEASDIEPPPDPGPAGAPEGLIAGTARAGERVVLLLDTGRVLSAGDATPVEADAAAVA